MMIGFIMLGRLSYDYAIRQLVMASLALGVCLLVPLFIERFTIWEKIGWQYALAGVLLLHFGVCNRCGKIRRKKLDFDWRI